MRGTNFFIAAGGGYVKSAQISEAITAKIASSIPNAPSGSAFVRWGLTPSNLDSLSVLITGVGRLGNSIIQTINALVIARCLNSTSILYPLFEAIGNRELLLDGGVSARQMKMLRSSEQGKPRIIWRTYAMKPEGVITSPCTPDFQIARKSLARALGIETTLRENAKDEKLLTIYLRSGDIFSPNPERNYGQPPWSFYEKILLSENWTEVRLISEDKNSPTHDLIGHWCESHGLRITETDPRLNEAIAEITQSTSLVSARGTFVPALLFLSPAKRNLYIFHELPNPLICLDESTVFVVRDLREEYVKALMSKNWKNTAEQRALMKTYPLSNLSDVSPH
jgi:hypothetical protein